MSDEHIVNFKRPPVVETVLGFQFEALSEFRNTHMALFWNILKSDKVLGLDWLVPLDTPPLEPAVETFPDGSWAGLGLQLKLTQNPASRIQIRSADDTRMVQLQNGRFHYNWLGHGGSVYPHYSQIRPEFDEVYRRLELFLADEQLGELKPSQWEVTYVNHLPKGSVWNQPQDWTGVFQGFPHSQEFPETLTLESMGAEWHFEIKPQLGRLHIRLNHGRTKNNGSSELLRLTLTARGPIAVAPDGPSDLGQGLELARKIIVSTFRAIASKNALGFWGLMT